ncbi:MAG: hypothetical protein M1820_006941 [Bogoriella megaspora]|nr:MAG: hypothetical protein M1820_006941 [Bogoriella megaspora]
MLPSSKNSLSKGALSAQAASWVQLACFLGGAAGIQVASHLFHRILPSHVVDCDHTHEEGDPEHGEAHKHDENGHHLEPHHPEHDHGHLHTTTQEMQATNGKKNGNPGAIQVKTTDQKRLALTSNRGAVTSRRPSLHARLSRGLSKVLSTNEHECNDDGPCHGFTEPCGQECFNNMFRKGGIRTYVGNVRPQGMPRSTTTPAGPHATIDEYAPLLPCQANAPRGINPTPSDSYAISETSSPISPAANGFHESTPLLRKPSLHSHHSHQSQSAPHSVSPHIPQHHHHVPTNAFLTLSLQTSIAIALHKLPEGFITYAANHANPRLGFAIFFALFVHNISEGFAMALPLYLALHSRWKAILWSSVLGGASQPLGAGIAAIWLHLAGANGGVGEPGEGVYGGLFAVTAGIMTSVALQLFAQALDKSHNRNLCMMFAFVGMGILSISNALTA